MTSPQNIAKAFQRGPDPSEMCATLRISKLGRMPIAGSLPLLAAMVLPAGGRTDEVHIQVQADRILGRISRHLTGDRL
jgi:hypothetical protein